MNELSNVLFDNDNGVILSVLAVSLIIADGSCSELIAAVGYDVDTLSAAFYCISDHFIFVLGCRLVGFEEQDIKTYGVYIIQTLAVAYDLIVLYGNAFAVLKYQSFTCSTGDRAVDDTNV